MGQKPAAGPVIAQRAEVGSVLLVDRDDTLPTLLADVLVEEHSVAWQIVDAGVACCFDDRAMRRPIKLPSDIFPSRADLDRARAMFEQIEPRDVFYRAALELVRLRIAEKSDLSLAEALAVLLKTWNAGFYQYKRVVFDKHHFDDTDQLLARHADALREYRSLRIEDFDDDRDWNDIAGLFGAFDQTLGAVGAAKALHLLAQNFFHLWDSLLSSMGFTSPATASS